MEKGRYRSLESLSDSDEEFHPNIDTKSYRKFIKEERRNRFESLKSKDKLSEEEAKELKELEYKLLPVVVEVPEDSFRMSKDATDYKCTENRKEDIINASIDDKIKETSLEINEHHNEDNTDNNVNTDMIEEDDYVNDLIKMLNHNSVSEFINLLDSKLINLDIFEDLVYLNLSEAIKEKNDDYGLELCKIGLLTKWAKEYGRAYILKLKENESKLDNVVKNHYKLSKEAIMKLSNQSS